MKSNRERAEKWAQAYLNSEDGKIDRAAWNEELKNFILYGKPTDGIFRHMKFDTREEMELFNKVLNRFCDER